MTRGETAAAIAVALCTLLPLPLEAQDGASVAMRGSQSLGVGAVGSTQIGYWVKAGGRTDVGLDAALALDDNDNERSWTISLRPTLKRYWAPEAAVAPYLALGFEAAWTKVDRDGLPGETTNRLLGGFVGVGIDWFPVQRVSLGADVGVRAGFTHDQLPSVLSMANERNGFQVRTASSGVRVHLYF